MRKELSERYFLYEFCFCIRTAKSRFVSWDSEGLFTEVSVSAAESSIAPKTLPRAGQQRICRFSHSTSCSMIRESIGVHKAL